MKKRLSALGFGFLYPISYAVLQFLTAFVAVFAYTVLHINSVTQEELTAFTVNISLPMVMVSAALLIFGTAGIYRLCKRSFWRETRLTVKPRLVGKLLLGGIGLNVLTIALMRIIPLPAAETANYEGLMQTLMGGGLLLALPIVWFVAPVAEEIVFRGLSYTALRRGLPVWLSVLLSAMLFGAVHFNWIQSTYATLLGVALALCFHWSGSLWAPILLHVSYNSSGNLVGNLLIGAETPLFLIIVWGVLGAALAVWCLFEVYWERSCETGAVSQELYHKDASPAE